MSKKEITPSPPRSNTLRIVSQGDGDNTKVYVGENESLQLDGVVAIQIHQIKPGYFVEATLKFTNVKLDITAECKHDSLERLVSDKARLDWLQENNVSVSEHLGWTVSGQEDVLPSIREAIDFAMGGS